MLKDKLLRRLQNALAKCLAYSMRRGVRIPYSDVSTLLDRLVTRHPENSLHVMRALVGDTEQLPIQATDIDRLINFSAYWRDEWVAEKAAQVPAGARVLDAGAGQCRYKSLFAHTDYRAQDFAQYQGTSDGPLQETWNYGAIDYVCDITDIPVESGSFDVVLCTEVLEHVPDPVSTLRELVRVTAPGGKLLLTAPLGSGVHQEPYHFYGGFSSYFYQKHLKDFGCDTVEAKPLGGLLRHVVQEIHRVGRVLEERGAIMTPERRYVMMDWLPRLLSELDKDYFVEQFTVGYLVEAHKQAAD